MSLQRLRRLVHKVRNLASPERAVALQLLTLGLTRGHMARAGRIIVHHDPGTWEFRGLSQNGEDGIIDYLLQHIANPSETFVEIGAGDGTENNTAWLAIMKQYHGLMIEGSREKTNICRTVFPLLNSGVQCINMFATQTTVRTIKSRMSRPDLDLLSVDIDGNDLYVVKTFLEMGLRPKILVLEYNASFGPNESVTIPYEEKFVYRDRMPDALYFGVSISGWRTFLEPRGYRFVTVDRSGVNGFFADPAEFPGDFFDGLVGAAYRDSRVQCLSAAGGGWESRWRSIRDKEYVRIGVDTL